ncbi:acyl-CoA dehydrogenase family protein [Natronomonas halophila]|uniref:acyl-CoA dehydrogenase family protein n=1 Tax=Natronomonas halophila TaxID=2747817 RepID=UPI0015B4F5C2|nr:acyl-CoA dehydrogenase family protein [Natronomonas halophila]QLD84230.1 acyl-CoA dehydrogenase family protein [Natronomonas halophila]
MHLVDYPESDRANELARKTRDLMDEVILPFERDLGPGEAISDSELESLREAAKDYGVYCPQMPEEYGGMGESFRDSLAVFEEAGQSLLGPPALRVDAPDEGNMHTIELAGTEAQKERWLPPLIEGEAKSAFSMTEPAPGGGSDPKMIKTTAEKDGDEWVIDGHKWWTSNGYEADVFLVMARTDQDAHPYEGCSIFLVPAEADGLELVRDVPSMDSSMLEVSHAEVRYDGVRVPEENILGAENEGFQIAQRRLGPARLTHCMRFCGMADRALAIARAYMQHRDAFGSSLADKQSLRHKIAEQELALHTTRTTTRDAARRISEGHQARIPVAMCKVKAARMVQEAVDLAIQCCGGAGLSRDLPLVDFYEGLRFFRIGDGADEVHLRSIAREAFEDEHVADADLANLPEF